MRPRIAAVSFLIPAALAALHAFAQTQRSEEHAFRVVELTRGLEQPWSLAFLPDGRMLVTEKAGRLRFVGKDFKLDPQPVAGLPQATVQGQGGLMDVALHPRFGDNGLLYLSYAARGEGGVSTELARGRLAGHRLEDVQVLFRQMPNSEVSVTTAMSNRLPFIRMAGE